MKRLSQQALRSIPVNSIAQCLTRRCDTKSVMRQLVRQDKCGYQYAFVTLAPSINVLEIAATAQISRHEPSNINSEKASNGGVLLHAFASEQVCRPSSPFSL